MIPTIDISLIGVLLAAWHVIVTIWGYVSQAFNWITQKALALALGSRFWATAFFLAGSFAVIELFATLIQYVVNEIASAVYGSVSFSTLKSGIDLLAKVVPLDAVSGFISFVVSCLGFYVTAQNYAMWYIKVYGAFLALRRSFKV